MNEDAVLKEIGKTYHVCPTYNGGRDWPYGAYNPQIQRHVRPTGERLHRFDRAHRSRSTAAVRLQHQQRRLSSPQAKTRSAASRRSRSRRAGRSGAGRRASPTTRPILATGGGLVFNGSMDRYLRALDADNGTVAVADAAPLAGGRRHRSRLQ